ncbi:unnamed protein product [Pedinophyceae sp. YPF-701]|nr:unnamed protein product [Pedinophyceae sp. YPF-701]
MHERLIAIARMREDAAALSRATSARKAQLHEDKRAELARFTAALTQQVRAAENALDGHLQEVHSWQQRASDLAQLLSMALRGTQPWPSPAEWAALEARIASLRSSIPSSNVAALVNAVAALPSARPPAGAAPGATGDAAASAQAQTAAAEAQADLVRLRTRLAEAEDREQRAQEALASREKACRDLEDACGTLKWQVSALQARLGAAERGRREEMEPAEALADLTQRLDRMLDVGPESDARELGDAVAALKDATGVGSAFAAAASAPEDSARQRRGRGVEAGAAVGAAGALATVAGGPATLKDQYRRMVVAMRVRFDQERELWEAKLAAQREGHERRLAELGHPTQVSVEEENEALRAENERLAVHLRSLRQEASDSAQYLLLKQRAESEARGRELRERYARDVAAARTRAQELSRELESVRTGTWAAEQLTEERMVHDAVAAAAVARAEEAHRAELAELQGAAAKELAEREEAMGLLLHELRGPTSLAHGPEWEACQAAGHSTKDPGCYVRSEHYYPTGLLKTIVAGRQS